MSSIPSTCSAASQGNALIVTILVEQLREAQAYKLRDDIISLLVEPRPTAVILELVNVTFIGSVGFLAFLGVRRCFSGGRIVLCNLSEPVRDVFSLCRLIGADANTAAPFETATTTAEALSMVGMPA